ncbi:ubiquitin-like modifier-activating enzyme 6 [Amphiura filiformis]|uniref:ubiquitin-like modifier-activating enzyme 6 n=1 Tax=Amphiura filiformis TaxID=82378 RepID=UPI003B21A8B4
METAKEDIDDSLYSRQRYVLGDAAMKKMAHSSVFLSGLGGLGSEIAKNVILAGIRSITLHDDKTAMLEDLSSNFFLKEDDISMGKNRAEACKSGLAELNPYVTVKISTLKLDKQTDLTFLLDFKCVVITESSLSLQQKIDDFCRSQQPPIQFIMADVYGVHSYVFCDFGDEFTIIDPDGFDPISFPIESITKSNESQVTALDRHVHGFKDGDHITFKGVKGMNALNGTTRQVKVDSPTVLNIGDLSGDEYQPYISGGSVTEVKMPKSVNFHSLSAELKTPSVVKIDYKKDPHQNHLAMCALLKFVEVNGHLPIVRSEEDATKLIAIAQKLNGELSNPIKHVSAEFITSLAYTARGSFVPLTSAMGGIVGQEVLKALTGKFKPILQWWFLDASEVSQSDLPETPFKSKGDRYDSLRICLGNKLVQKLADLQLFMPGCGAIGCEMLKNYALLGVASGKGKITVTDDDLIEKSNLNRQFLFRSNHIQQPKSTTAAESALENNKDLKVEALQKRVCSDTEKIHFNDAFFMKQDVVINALDGYEARRYVDGRCVKNSKPLFESGTEGIRGHVQVIIPGITETYSAHGSPKSTSIPFCTLKYFPSRIEHTIQWARDEFESLFCLKPIMLNNYWDSAGLPEQTLKSVTVMATPLDPHPKSMDNGLLPTNTSQVVKILKKRPATWKECVSSACLKFENDFNHKAKQLLHSYPEDARTDNGELFWKYPRRKPMPVAFDPDNEMHMMFIETAARLLAFVYNVDVTEDDVSRQNVNYLLKDIETPTFEPKNKVIVTDASVTKDEGMRLTKGSNANIAICKQEMRRLKEDGKLQKNLLHASPVTFEKDDDTNGHIDFITSASNLRATMYGIEIADRYTTKRITGNIIPAIATTTSAVAGLATLEMIRYVKGGAELTDYRNCFLSLGRCDITFLKPDPPVMTKLKHNVSFSVWDMWHVNGNSDFKMQDFIKFFKDQHKLAVTLVLHGTDTLYMSESIESIQPNVESIQNFSESVSERMVDLIEIDDGTDYVDLRVLYEREDPENSEDIEGPAIRYHF